jgi:serine/threonine protein kinase
VAERSFGGYAYQQRLGTGVFGEIYRALSGAGKEARILHVDPRLATQLPFVRALVQFGERSLPLDHPRVVGLRQVGRSGDHMVVVTDPVSGPVAVRELCARCGGPLPLDIALAIGLGAIEGLASAHSLRVVHGAVHPRSVLVDFHGGVMLADFGVAWALIATAAETGDMALLHELSGFLAPELALGQLASEVSDVYAAGALLSHLLTGRPPPGELDAPAAVTRIIGRALAVDPGARLINASELEELLEEAIAADRCPVARPEDVAAFVAERLASSDDALHSATEDLVAGLVADTTGRSMRVTDLLASLESDPPRPDAPAARAAEAEIDREPAGDMTEVDPRNPTLADTDLIELLRLGDVDAMSAPLPHVEQRAATLPMHGAAWPLSSAAEQAAPPAGPAVAAGFAPATGELYDEADSTPLPRPAPHRPGSVTRHLGAIEAEGGVAALRRTLRLPRMLWAAVIAFALAALGMVIYTQADLFHPERRAAEERAADRADRDALARHEASQPVPVELSVTSTEADAAVWLLLGRTPLESLPMSAAMVHELRLERDGYHPSDVRVTGYQWKEEGGALRASVTSTLTPGEPRAPVPSFPPAGAGAAPPSGPGGRGVVHVESDPAGAHVWLLIGFTPRATIAGLEAGRDYQVKVLKDGFRPGTAAVRAEEWYLSGPGGPVTESLAREVTLTREPDRRSGKSRKRKR